MGTAKEKWGRKVKGRLLAKTGGLCPSLDHRLLPWANELCRKELLMEQITEREGVLPLSFLPYIYISPGFFFNVLDFEDLSCPQCPARLNTKDASFPYQLFLGPKIPVTL